MFTFFLPASPYSAEVEQYFSRVAIADSEVKDAVEVLIDGLVSDGVWSKIDVLCAVQDTQASSLTNLKSSSFTSTLVGAPVFTVRRGFDTLAATNYIDTNYSLDTGGINLTTTDNHQFAYIPAISLTFSSASGSGIMGLVSPPENPAKPAINGATLTLVAESTVYYGQELCIGVPSDTTVTDGKLRFYGATNKSTDIFTRRLNTASSTLTAYTTACKYFQPLNAYVGTINNKGAVYGTANDTLRAAAWGYGGGLSTAELAAYDARITTYMTTIGAAV